jgi:5,10-methylenetetrahydromethanopterin reductase
MRLGLLIAGSRPTPAAVELARAAAAAGITDLWVSEDYFERGAFVVATAVAAAVPSARVGIGVVNPWTRHPMLTAMEFGALDELSEGRAVLGLGASNRVWMQDRCGIPFTAPIAALREATGIIRDALAGAPVDAEGQHFRTHARLSFTGPRTSVPIYYGVKGRRALELAAELADGVLLSLLSAPAYVAWAKPRLGALDVGAYVLASCDPDAEKARAAVRRPLATYLGVHGDHDITRTAGLPTALAHELRAGWQAGTPAEHLITDELIDTFAVAGDRDHCRAGLDRLVAAGLDCAVLRDPGDDGVTGLLELASPPTKE